MKKSVLLTIFLMVVVLIVLPLIHPDDNQVMSSSAGAPAQYTGSPGDGRNCTSCHAGPTPAARIGWITSNIPASGYLPNTTYVITATATGPGHTKFGFQVSPQSLTGTLLGSLAVTSAQTQLVGSGKYVTHTSTGTAGTGSKSWSFNWTSPAAGTTSVVFYGAFNLSNSLNNSSGDTILLSQLAVNQALLVSASVNSNVNCAGATNGSASVTASGGVGPYTYSWNTTPAITTATATGLAAGTYTVTVTDALSATATASVIITQPSSVNVNVLSQTNVSCNGGSNGSATIQASGGNGSFTYQWNTIPAQTGPIATGLSAQTYNVVVTDGNSCSTSAQITITEPSALVASITNQTNASCNGDANGSATINGSGGTAPYSYQWNTVPVQTSASATNLIAGNYTAIITDSRNCSASASLTITQPSPISVSVQSTVPANCNGGNTGSILLNNPSGGTAPYSYSWNTPVPQNTQGVTGLSAGTYTVTVSDANNCTQTLSANITEPDPIIVSLPGTVSLCSGTCVNVATVASGGVGPYTYTWNPSGATGNTLLVCADDSVPSYTLNVADANLCFAQGTINVLILPLPSVSLTIPSDTLCSNGSDVVLSGIPAGGIYYGTAMTNDVFSPSTAGIGNFTLSYTYEDLNGCASGDSVNVTVQLCSGLDQTEQINVSVYPNPSNGIFYVKSNRQLSLITVSNMLGEIVFEKQIDSNNGEIDLSEMQSGVYFIRVQNSSGVFMKNGILRR